MTIRIGHGFDVHAFGHGDHIMLAGIKVPHSHGFIAHSDGDVALHALTDAILGATAQGDIGRHFPDTDEQWKGANSMDLLLAVWKPLQASGWFIHNLDLTIVAQAPKLMAFINLMQQRLSDALGLELDQVNVKATTTEKLGYTGRKEGVATHAVVLLGRNV